MALIDDLLLEASNIRDAEQDKENTALRVGTMLVDILQYIAGFVSVEGLQAVLADYAPLQGALVHWRNSRVVCLASMGTDLDNIDGGDWQYTNHAGDIVFNPSGRNLSIVGEQGNYSVFPGVFYVNLHSRHCYVWDATTQAMVEITDSSRPTIIDYRNNPPFAQVAIGESYYFESGSAKKIAIKTSSSGSYSFDPDPKKIYVFKDTCESMIWDATTRSWITVGSNDSGVAPSLISQIISNIDLVNSRINTLIDDLAGLAFTGAKTAKTELDWDGTKVTVSLNTSGLSGCRVQETFPKQVLEGSSATITIVPTNDSHLLRNASYKIGANGEAHEVVISGNKAIINLSQINENITVYLTASATAKGSFTASISDSRVSGTGATSDIAEGSAWLSQLSLNGTAEEGASITFITATMEGGGTINVSGNIVSTNNVTGNIHITVTVVVVGRVSLSFPALSSGVKITDNNNNNAVVNDGVSSLTLIENSSISWKIGAIEGYRLNGIPSIQMESGQAGQSIVPTDNGDGTYNLTIAHVTGNVVITAAAREVVAHTVTKKLLNYTASDDGTSTTDADFGYKKKSVEDGDDYSVTLSLANSAISNNDLLVKMGGVALDTDNTKTSYYTFDSSNGALVVKNVTADVTIIATAATGVVKVTSNAAVTGGITINGTAHDLAVGDTTINGITSITALAFSADAKTAITALDFGGATTGISFDSKFKDFTSLTDFYGLVITSSCQSFSMTFQGCTNLETLSTIGWCPVLRYINTLVSGCAKLEALDLSSISFLNNCNSLYSIASGCTSMTKLVLPALEVPSITDLRTMFSGSHITYVDMSDLVLTGVTNMNTMLSNAQIGTLDIRGINTSTTGPTTLQFWSQNAVIGTLIIGQFDMARVTDISFTTTKISRIVCTTTTPPSINPDKNWVSQQEDVQIYVPASAVETYKSATGWSAVAERIHSINEYSE